MRQTFQQWFAKVKLAVTKRCGLDVLDLPDCPYADWYEDGVSPASAARRAVKTAGE